MMVKNSAQAKSPETDSVDDVVESPIAVAVFAMVILPAMAGAYLAMRGLAGFGALEGTMLAAGILLTGFGITGGYHRLVTHRSYALSPVANWIVIALGSMALQGSVFDWAATHRQHHQFSDRAGDPHSPVFGQRPSLGGKFRGFLHAHAGWFFDSGLRSWSPNYIPDLMADPQVTQLNGLFPVFAVLSIAIPTLIGALVRGTVIGALDGLFWGAMIRIVFVYNMMFSINSICHLIGTRPYPTRDDSRNNFIIAFLTIGEGWHNNHHAFPTSAYHGLRWWQIDVTGWVISTLQIMHIATNVKIARER